MEPRVTRFWLPGLLGFALAMILEVVSYRFDSHPLVLSLDRGTPILRFHISWIFALLLVGAIAAYLSRRAGRTAEFSVYSVVNSEEDAVAGHGVGHASAAEGGRIPGAVGGDNRGQG